MPLSNEIVMKKRKLLQFHFIKGRSKRILTGKNFFLQSKKFFRKNLGAVEKVDLIQ